MCDESPREHRPPACAVVTGTDAGVHPPGHEDERIRHVWAAGDDAVIAAGYADAAAAFVHRLELAPGLRVLDAACGTGTATLPASRGGADVTGTDLVASAVASARARAHAEGLPLALDVASVEALPYADGAFDVVLSFVGVMFAARPDRVLDELARVTRPGGRLAIASWTPDGFMGRLHGILAAHAPPAPHLPDPLRWGDASAIAEWLDDGRWDATLAERPVFLRHPHAAGGVAELYRAAHGPTIRAFATLDADGRAALAADLVAHWSHHARPDPGRGSVTVETGMLEVRAVRRRPP